MKVRESGMPEEKIWNDLFDVDLILSSLQINNQVKSLVEIGGGYGTFTIPAAKIIQGKIYTFDIEGDMIDILKQKIFRQNIDNIVIEQRDILETTTGLVNTSVDYVMLFNILHHDSPTEFFNESYRILEPGGKIGIIHWRSDIDTPRGPDLSIRPKPEDILNRINKQQFQIEEPPFIIEPYHYGLILRKNDLNDNVIE